jgi:8-oxo-dGTP diphosphatase
MTAMKPSSKKIIEVGCAIIRKKDQILIAQRHDNDHMGGFWEFPGGKRCVDESLENCLVREVREELGIVITADRLLEKIDHDYPERILSLHFYLCDWVSGNPSRIDCQDFRWVYPEQMRDFKFPPADDGIINELITNKKAYFK